MPHAVRVGRSGALAFVVTLAAVVGLTALGPSAAAAAPCLQATPLYDSGSFRWDVISGGFISDGAIGDGGYDPQRDNLVNLAAGDRRDSYDNFGRLRVSVDGTFFTDYANPNANGCSAELDGRQIAYPADTATLPGVSISRKVFVPASGQPFARWLDVFSNTSGAPVTFAYRFGGDLGSDTNTQVIATSSGDTTIDASDRWASTGQADTIAAGGALDCATEGSPARCDPALGHSWDQEGATVADRADTVALTGQDPFLFYTYEAITIQPGQTLIYMHVEEQRLTPADATAAAREKAAGPGEVFFGLSEAECAALQNWVCPRAASPGPPPPGAARDDVPAAASASVPSCSRTGSLAVRVSDPPSAARSGPRFVRFRIDGGPVSTQTVSGDPGQATIAVPAGRHSVEYWGEDAAGNQQSPHHSQRLTVDRTRPSLSITGPRTVRRGQRAFARVRARDRLSGLRVNPTRRRRLATGRPGRRTLVARAVDRCGNRRVARFAFRVLGRTAQLPRLTG